MVNKRTASWESKCSPQDSFSWLIKRIGRIYSARLSWSISRIWWNQFGWCRESFCCVIEKNWESSSDKIKRDTHACSDSVASRGYKWRFTVLSGHLYSFVPLWNLKMSLSILYLTNNTGVPKPEILRPKQTRLNWCTPHGEKIWHWTYAFMFQIARRHLIWFTGLTYDELSAQGATNQSAFKVQNRQTKEKTN